MADDLSQFSNPGPGYTSPERAVSGAHLGRKDAAITFPPNTSDTPNPAFLPEASADARPFPFWNWLDVVGFLVVLVTLVVISALLAVGTGLTRWMGNGAALVLAQGVGMGISLALLSMWFNFRYDSKLREAFRLGPPQRVLFFGALGLGVAVVVSIFGRILHLSELEVPMKDFIQTDLDLVIVGLGAVTFGPLFEEVIFRGFLQPLLARSLGITVGILLTSLLFALPHGTQYGWHWQHLLAIACASSIFGYIRWRYDSTTASTLAHSTYNGLLVAAAFAQRLLNISP